MNEKYILYLHQRIKRLEKELKSLTKLNEMFFDLINDYENYLDDINKRLEDERKEL